ncbi:hypothetical protein U27_06648 [Candidatus Vecturithrix granuli]|uniref:SSD domain-containing protein n=1 Tax=Vecturithrix granuli TaxID=1499967 RepID=A0A081C508_VECG1|nr:hypothetical protein U27_06648 [Candidatus Vecturithrix granuli]
MIQNLEVINQWFAKAGKRLLQVRWWILCLLILLDLLAIRGIQRIQFDVSNESWFLDNDPITIARREFEEIFGNPNYVAVLVEAEDVFAPEILRVIRELGEELEEEVPFADEVVSLTKMEFTRGTEEGVEIGDIVPPEIPTTPEEIEAIRQLAFSKPFLVNRLFSDDSTQAWIMLRLHKYSDHWDDTLGDYPQMAVGKKVFALLGQEKYVPYRLHAAGAPIGNYEERLFFSQEASRTMVLAFITAILILFGVLRSFQGVVVPLIAVISSILWVFGSMGYLNIKIDTMVMTLPIYLGMAVSIGYSIHLFNFFNKGFSSIGRRDETVIFAVQETGWPILFTAITTIGALASFYFVPVRQVRWMGLSSAAVVFATYIIVMTFTPVLLSFGKDAPPHGNVISTMEIRLEKMFLQLGRWILLHSTRILIVFVLITLFFLGGLPRMYISMNEEKTFGLQIPYIARFYYIAHTRVGTRISYDVMLTFDEPGQVKDPEILQNFELLISEIQQFPLVKRVSSLLDIIKDMNQVMHSDDPAFYRIPDDKALIAQLLLLYEMSNGTEQENWVDYEYTRLRLLVEVVDPDTAEVEREFQYLRRRAQELFPQARFAMVGGLVQYSVIQNYIAKGEIVSFLIALVVIGILMMIVFQSVKTGLIGMIPNIAPVIVVGGMMGYLDIPLEMTTMMIIPMLLGLAVDDTIHFITHSKLEVQRTGNYQQSIEKTFQTVGKAMFLTSFILIATFSVYLTSIARFFVNLSILAIAGVSSALLADYFVTPILIHLTRPFDKLPLSKTTVFKAEEKP